ncbi:MAG: type IV secretion system DNA-binding domain-containing protein [Gallionella sp.]
MNEQKRYTHYFGPIPTNLPPDTEIIRMDHAVVGGLVFTLFFFILGLMLLWRELPGFGIAPDTLKIHFKFWFQTGMHALVPAFFEPETLRYQDWLNQVPFMHFWGRVITAGIFGSLGGFWIAKMIAKPRDQFIHVSGGQLQKSSEAERQAERFTKAVQPYLYVHPKLGLSKEECTTHMLICGGVGSGKTVKLLQILKQIFKKNEKLILYDIKGDFTRKFPEALLMSPWDKRSVVWDIAKDIDTESAMRSFASSLFPTKADDKNKYFQEGAASILLAIIREMYFKHQGNWGWHHLNKAAARSCKELYATMVRFNPEQAPVLADEKSTGTIGVIGTFSGGILVITQLATAWGEKNTNERFSFKKWLRDDYQGKRQIILQGGKDSKLQGTYISAIVNSLIPEIISPSFEDNELGRSLFFVFDEFPTLGRIEIQPLVALGRSKGCIVILGLQDIAQVREVYGDDFAKSLPAMVGTQIICRVGLGETRQKLHQLIGKKRVATMQNNISNSQGQQSVSTSYNEQERELLNESDITTMLGPQLCPKSKEFPVGKFIRSILLSGEKMMMLEWPVVPFPNVQAGVVEADWCKSVLENSELIRENVPASKKEAADPTVPLVNRNKPTTEITESNPSAVLNKITQGSPQAILPAGSSNVGIASPVRDLDDDDEAKKREDEEAARLIEEELKEDKSVQKAVTTTIAVPEIVMPDADDIWGEEEMEGEDIFGSLGLKMVASSIPGADLVLEGMDLAEGSSSKRRPIRFVQQTQMVMERQ